MTNQAVICIPEPKLRSMFCLLLADTCVSVASCPDLDEVFRVVSERFCQLCVLTYESSADMAQFIERVRHVSPDTKIILIAHREDAAAILPLLKKGLSDTILRPINPKQAVNALQVLLNKQDVIEIPTCGGTNPPFGGNQIETVYRPLHLVARSVAMRSAVNALWAARKNPIGLILRGEPGCEFELAAREFQAMSGDLNGYVVVLSQHEFNVESLATQVALDRLNDGVQKTYYLPDVEKLSPVQTKELVDFLRRERRERDTMKPLRMVFTASLSHDAASSAEPEIIETLQLIMPAIVTLPSLRERREDVALLVRRILMDLTAIFTSYPARSLHPATLQWLCERPWPGNYQELVTAISNAVMKCSARELTAGHFGKLTESQSATTFDHEEAAAGRVLAVIQRASRS